MDMEILEYIDKMTWKSKQKIMWSDIQYSDKEGFEAAIAELKVKGLITNLDFPHVKLPQLGLRTTNEGHRLINNEGVVIGAYYP